MKPATLILTIFALSAAVSLDCIPGTATASRHSSSRRQPIRFGSFNIQIFGRKKARDAFVMNNLARILNRYDILVVMEIRDKSGEAFRKLVERANRDERRDPFSYVISVRTGRTVRETA
uniref:Endo/exonuclease/phosphatase domain-containing protein n=1 Tax=Macrostomum lignano TaxID=282301 RepID=A0A1I8HEH9_9PLAT